MRAERADTIWQLESISERISIKLSRGSINKRESRQWLLDLGLDPTIHQKFTKQILLFLLIHFLSSIFSFYSNSRSFSKCAPENALCRTYINGLNLRLYKASTVIHVIIWNVECVVKVIAKF